MGTKHLSLGRFIGRLRPQQRSRLVKTLCSVFLLVLLFVALRSKLSNPDLASMLLLVMVAALGAAIFFHARFLVQARFAHRESETRFQQMASNIQELFWMIDVVAKKLLYVNDAWEKISGCSREMLEREPLGCLERVHAADRSRVSEKMEMAIATGRLDERFRIVCPNGEIRWIWARGFPVHSSLGAIRHLVGTAQDITEQKLAEEQVNANLAMAEAARAEADALSQATLALTQDLHMDYVLDRLLQCVEELVGCESAQVLLVESEMRLFLGRERLCRGSKRTTLSYPQTVAAADSTLLRRVLLTRKSLILSDTAVEKQWSPLFDDCVLSWLCVPLIASQEVLGLISLNHSQRDAFNAEDLRRTEVLAIPAAVAIQNARLYERAEIYGSELALRIEDLRQVQDALDRASGGRKDPRLRI